MARSASVPRFFLYGEPPRDAEERFVHIETIADRSRLHGWEIRAHTHRDLHQILVILGGGGTMRAENTSHAFAAPALLLIPAGVVHAFVFEKDTRGYVVTVADRALADLAVREPAFQALFEGAMAVDLRHSALEAHEIEEAVVRLQREFQWTAPAHAAATEARLMTLLVCAVRATHQLHGTLRGTRGPRAALVARFRQAVEANLRAGWELSRYAKALGVTPSRLRDACLDVTGHPPTHIVHERLILEAKRSLRYTNMTVAETAYDLGFSDPAYFSRFFSERVGMSPAEFRRRSDG
ncbi:MAG TPA: helix-turn-helix domain-containing protein [Steroidobacteraceae bacterium]|nr:helix-turn-helix domain-containing protein [Steroidobacteraceae bacterium]